MTKGYVLVDMPESCSECQLCSYDDIMGFVCCGLINDDNLSNFFGYTLLSDDMVHNDLKPEWCPIKEFPEKYGDENVYEPDFGEFRKGYNNCLKEILGGANK